MKFVQKSCRVIKGTLIHRWSNLLISPNKLDRAHKNVDSSTTQNGEFRRSFSPNVEYCFIVEGCERTFVWFLTASATELHWQR